MADFRTIPGSAGVHYVGSTFIISRNDPAEIALRGGGPRGEDLTLFVLDPKLIDVFDWTYVAAPLGDHLRRIRLQAKGLGQTTLQARLGAAGPTWAEAKIAVEGTIISMGDMFPARDAPMNGSIPLAAGIGSIIRIPIPGTNGLAIELSPRNFRGKSTSSLFIQDSVGKRVLRLDYGPNVKTNAVDFHWNQKGTFKEFGIADHSVAGSGGEALYRSAKYFKYAGRVVVVIAATIDIYSVVVSTKPLRQATKVAAGWAGAWAGCKVAGAANAAAGTAIEPGFGTAIGGIVGCAVGGFLGYESASAVAGYVYDWAEGTLFTHVPPFPAP